MINASRNDTSDGIVSPPPEWIFFLSAFILILIGSVSIVANSTALFVFYKDKSVMKRV